MAASQLEETDNFSVACTVDGTEIVVVAPGELLRFPTVHLDELIELLTRFYPNKEN